MKKAVSASVILSTLLFAFAIATPHSATSQTETKAEAKLPAGLIALSKEEGFSNYSFVVDKTKRTLSVYETVGDEIKLVEEHPADIGKNSGPKTRENDHKTPVGIYFLESELSQPAIPFATYGNLAFTTDYPNIFDRRELKTGYGIWLHAVPDTVPLTRGSRGCVVVRNDVVKLLKKYVTLGQTPILIYDEVEYLNSAEYKTQKTKFLTDFENWRTAWETQDVDTYIKYYDDTFRNDQMNYKQWYRHKKKLKNLYSYIKVNLSSPLILKNKDQVVIRTVQRYESNLHRDYGVKTIHARWSPEVGFKIIREDWKPLLETLASSPSEKSAMETTAREAAGEKKIEPLTGQAALPSSN